MLMIRFQRIGRTNDPAFRIVLTEKERAAKTGNIVEQLGTYNPTSKALTLDGARIKEWLGKGAQATVTVHNLLVAQGVVEGKKRNALPKKTPAKKDEPVAEAAPSAEPAPAEEAPAPEAAAEAAPAAQEPAAAA